MKCTIYWYKGQISAICNIVDDIPNGIAVYRRMDSTVDCYLLSVRFYS